MSWIQARPRVSLALLEAALVTLAFFAIVSEIARQDARLDLVAEATAIVSLIALPSATTLFYVDWQVRRDPQIAWLVVVCAVFALQNLRWLVMLLGGDVVAGSHSAWVGVYQVTVVCASVLLLALCRRLPLRLDPLLSGLLGGLAVLVGQGLVLRLPSTTPPPGLTAVLVAVLLAIGAAGGVVVVRTQPFGGWCGRCLVAAGMLLATSQATLFAPVQSPQARAAIAAVQMLGAVLLMAAAALRAQASVLDEVSAAQVLRHRLQDATDDRHSDAARFHEIRSTIAGLTAATELLRRDGVSASRRTQLQSMVEAELARLARMVGAGQSTTAHTVVRLDDAIRPVVLRNEAQGLTVQWQPSGYRVETDPDLLAEIVDILLSNARAHAPSSAVRVTIAREGERVELTVADSGPGIDPGVRDRVFEWGVRSPTSRGQGVGLAAARLLADDLRARLRIAPPCGEGTTFVLSLPVAQPADASQAGRPEHYRERLSSVRRTSTSPSRPRRPHGSPGTPAARWTGM